MDWTRYYDSPLGLLVLESDGEALTGVRFVDREPSSGASGAWGRALPVFDAAVRWLDIYFSGSDPGFTPPLNMRTTPFRKRVWELMLKIPYGETATYGDLARVIAGERGLARMSAQAVGGAVGHNAIPVIIPCHRVVGAGGDLTGYGGGMARKVRLLALEGVDMTKFFVPSGKDGVVK